MNPLSANNPLHERRAADRGPIPDLVLREERIDLSHPSPLFNALHAALAAEGLPVDDLQDPGKSFFAYFSSRDTLAGFGGFETHGQHALVRSVVVLPGYRGQGLVWQIVPRVLARAMACGATQAWLLTEGASSVFSRLGFTEAERSEVPEEIGSTRQFSKLCASSATLMRRSLGPELA